MADKKYDRKFSKFSKDITNMNTVFTDLIKELDVAVAGASLDRRSELKRLGSEVNKLARQELDSMNIDLSTSDFSKFIKNTYKKADSELAENSRPEDIFKAENNDVLRFFQERYKSKYYLYDDLDLICQQIPELREAVKTTRDSVINSDDITSVVSKKITFVGVNEETAELARKEVKKIEDEYKLDKVVKNIIGLNSIKYGEYYTYGSSYADIIDRYHYINNSQENYHINAMENISFDKYDKRTFEYLSESVGMDMVPTQPAKTNSNVNTHITRKITTEEKEPIINDKKSDRPTVTEQEVMETLNFFLKKYKVYNDDIPIPLVEGISTIGEIDRLMNGKSFNKMATNAMQGNIKTNNTKTEFADGTVDYSTVEAKRNKSKDMGIKGMYLKHINPKHLIPIRVMDDVILGYYWIREETDLTQTTNQNMTFGLNSSFSMNLLSREATNKNLEREMVSKLVEKIVKAFDKKYLEENKEFKELIINALMFDETYKKNICFQFISPEFIVHHSIEENGEGQGTSILMDSVFNAKLYLGLLLFKMLAIISKSNDTRIYTVQNSIDDQDKSNNVQRIIREIKGNQMSYMDLMNYNSLISKIGANKSIFMQAGSNGTAPVTFDILAGQQVELNTELMEMLKNSAINATGVPSVLMQNFGEVDFAKQLEILNIKHANRSSSIQLDLNPSITQMYKMILRHTTELDDEVIDSLQYTLNPPKASNIMNASEQASNSDSLINYMIEKKYEGNPSYSEEEVALLKAKKTLELAKYYNPNLPWDILDDDRDTQIEIKADKMKVEIDTAEPASEPSGDVMGGEEDM